MSELRSADHLQSRAIILAALIGVGGAIAAALVGREWGERRAEGDTSRLEVRIEQQERALQAMQERVSAKDATIQSLTQQLHSQRVSGATPIGATSPATNGATAVAPSPAAAVEPAADSQPPTLSEAQAPTESNGGLEVTLLGCTATGTAVTCGMRVTNTRPDRQIRLWAERGSRIIDQDGNERRASAASIGTNRMTFFRSDNDLAEATPTRASLYFENVPSSARKAALLQVTFAEGQASFDVKFREVPIDRN